MKPKTSAIWGYFIEIDESSAKCIICEKVYSRKGRTTTALKSHLKSIHVTEFEQFEKLDGRIKQTLEAKNQKVINITPAENADGHLSLEQSITMKTKRKISAIWEYFVVIDESRAKCLICDRMYSRKGRTTTALKSHLKSIHVAEFKEFEKLDERMKQTIEEKKQKILNITPTENAEIQWSLDQRQHEDELWDSTHPKSQQIDCAVAEMIALQNLPFDFVEGIGFRRLLNVALPNYKLRGRDFFSTYVCDDLYNKLAMKIKELLVEFEKISFTRNIWVEPESGMSLLSLTAHGITKDFRKMSIVLKCDVMEERHTDDIIKSKFETTLQEWNISQRAVHCTVSDHESKTIQRMQSSRFKNVNCSVHQIQQCIRAGVESQEWLVQLIGKFNKIATHFKHSLVAQATLTKIQTGRLFGSVNQTALPVTQDCPTSWSSTFYMLERFTKLKDSLDLYLTANEIVKIFPEDWMNVEQFVQIMKPFEEITRELCISQVSISSVIPLVHVLLTILQREGSKPETSEQFRNFTRKLFNELNSSTKFGELTKNYMFTIATYLDPRYKSKFFNEIVLEAVESKILNLITSNHRNIEQDDSNPPFPKRSRNERNEYDDQASTSRATETRQNQTLLQTLESMLSMDEDDWTTNSDSLLFVLKSTLQEYKKERTLPLQEDPLMWWRLNAVKYTPLLPLVRQYLSVPPSSIASEQLFSGAGLIDEEHRERLNEEKVAKLLFAKYNLPLLNFDY